jgi:hypothetical protein
MIGQVDDTSKFREADLKPYTLYPNYGVTACLCWSRNVTDERDAPDQVLFGAMDPKYDVLSALGLWSEYLCQTNPQPNEFIFGSCGLDDPVCIKKLMSRILKHILSPINLNGHRLGTHSLLMLVVTFAHGAACSKVSQSINMHSFCIDTNNKNYFVLMQDDTDCHGRWKNPSHQHDTYASTSIPCIDAKVVAALCKGCVCVHISWMSCQGSQMSGYLLM